HKGHDILLEVLSSNKWKQRGIELHIYGTGYDKSYIEELIHFFNLEELVTMHGKVSDIRKIWKENHLLLMPSLNEGMALAVIEAMICGRPVVTTDVGGNVEWIVDNINGFIAEGANVRSFDSALERAWSRRDEWELIGRNAHETAILRYDKEPGKTFLNFILAYGDRS
ncbi:MAG: glycosyltransferase, partial [Sphingobacteriales bacterium]